MLVVTHRLTTKSTERIASSISYPITGSRSQNDIFFPVYSVVMSFCLPLSGVPFRWQQWYILYTIYIYFLVHASLRGLRARARSFTCGLRYIKGCCFNEDENEEEGGGISVARVDDHLKEGHQEPSRVFSLSPKKGWPEKEKLALRNKHH